MANPDPATTHWVPIWNSKDAPGPVGPQGPPGATGPQGPQGPQGAAGTSVAFLPGMMMMWGAGAAPVGWLLCDGTAYSRAAFPALFAAILTTWGAPDGATFNVPSLSGRVPMGAGSGAGLTARSVGQLAGVEAVALTTPQLPSHFHPITDRTHSHAVLGGDDFGIAQATLGYGDASGASYKTEGSRGTALIGGAFSNINATDGAGGDQAHTNVQPSAVVTFIIKY